MADQVTIKPETNKVELADQRRQILVTDNRTGTSINLTQDNPQVVQVSTLGPQGATGPPGQSGAIPPSGSYSGSFSGSFSGSVEGTGTGSYSGSFEGVSTGSFSGSFIGTSTGSFSGSFDGDGSGIIGVISASYAETASFAISASVEIVKELSSSFADTASLAQSGEGDFTGSFLVTDHILPDTSQVYDLGSPERRFRDLYLSGSTLFLGGTALGVDDQGGLTVVASGSDVPLASNLSGSFTGSYSGSIKTTDFLFNGELLNVLGNVFVQGTLDAATKNFKIDHPTKPDYYLVHSSLEGPERGMYVRGKLQNEPIIHLPEYWNELTEVDDITVQLTPIGSSCTHYIKSISKEKIEIGCDCGEPHCFYIVHAQRNNEGKFEILQPKHL